VISQQRQRSKPVPEHKFTKGLKPAPGWTGAGKPGVTPRRKKPMEKMKRMVKVLIWKSTI
jgi:hypothetical protein